MVRRVFHHTVHMAREVSGRDDMRLTLCGKDGTIHFLRKYIMSEAFIYRWYDAPNDMYYLLVCFLRSFYSLNTYLSFLLLFSSSQNFMQLYDGLVSHDSSSLSKKNELVKIPVRLFSIAFILLSWY